MTKRPSSIEFPRKIKSAAFARANGHCETCGLPFKAGAEYDHILPAALGGEPTLANCRAICQPCHKAKTSKEDIPRIRKADRQKAAAIGAKAPAKQPIMSRGFYRKQRQPKPSLPHRPMFKDAR